MGDWWIDDAPYPGPVSSPTLAEIGQAYAAYGRRVGRVFAAYSQSIADALQASAEMYVKMGLTPSYVQAPTPKNKRPKDYHPPKKIPLPVTHVGPRPTHQFAHRGRLKI